MSNYGNNFSIVLFQAGAELIDGAITIDTNLDSPISEEITGGDIRNALLTIVDWLQSHRSADALEPLDEYITDLRDFKEFTPMEVAECLLKVTHIFWLGDESAEEGVTAIDVDIETERWCLTCYQEMIYSFLDVLCCGCDFETSAMNRTVKLRRRLEEAGVVVNRRRLQS